MGCVSAFLFLSPNSILIIILRAVFALDVVSKDSSSVARAVYHDFVPLALERGTLKCKPDPLVAGEGLKDVQKGLDVQKKGVSAKKVVVSGIQI